MWHYAVFTQRRQSTRMQSAPNILSSLRFVFAALMFYFTWQGQWYVAVTILWLSVFSDMLDGYLARKFKAVTVMGGLLDHGSDAMFVTATIAALVTHGIAPQLLPVMIPLAFTQYMLDSEALRGKPLRASFIGRYNGIGYYVFAGWPIMQYTLNLTVIPFDWFYWIGWVLVATTAVSMGDRAYTLFRSSN